MLFAPPRVERRVADLLPQFIHTVKAVGNEFVGRIRNAEYINVLDARGVNSEIGPGKICRFAIPFAD